MNASWRAWTGFLAVATLAVVTFPSVAAAAGYLEPPISREFFGQFDGRTYELCKGRFVGRTTTGNYRVPYELTRLLHPEEGNRSVLLELPHYRLGCTWARDYGLSEVLFGRMGVQHASVGYSTAYADTPPQTGRFLFLTPRPGDPDPLYIMGGKRDEGGRTDDEILVDFAKALRDDPLAQVLLGTVERVYASGVSDSSYPLKRILNGGFGVFDLSIISGTDSTLNPQDAMDVGKVTGKVIVRESELEVVTWRAALLRDRHDHPSMYREYEVAGAPHSTDVPCLAPGFPLAFLFTSPTSPIDWAPIERALLLAGDRWVRLGEEPPPSVALEGAGNRVVRDALGNATGGVRLPAVELGEATFKVGFVGTVNNPRSIGNAGFYQDFDSYFRDFGEATHDLVRAGFLLPQDARALIERAKLSPPNTFTQNYLDKALWDAACGRKNE